MGSMITKLMCGSFSNMCALCCSACPTLQSQGLEPSQAPLSTEFSRQEYWRWLPSPIPGDLLHPGMEPTSLESLILAGGFFITAPPGKPHFAIYKTSNHVYTLNLIQCYMSITLNKTCAGSSLEHLSALFDSINIHYLLKESERGPSRTCRATLSWRRRERQGLHRQDSGHPNATCSRVWRERLEPDRGRPRILSSESWDWRLKRPFWIISLATMWTLDWGWKPGGGGRGCKPHRRGQRERELPNSAHQQGSSKKKKTKHPKDSTSCQWTTEHR